MAAATVMAAAATVVGAEVEAKLGWLCLPRNPQQAPFEAKLAAIEGKNSMADAVAAAGSNLE